MDERISRDDYREIVQSLSIIRLQGWLLQRFADGMVDEAELIERLEDINQQSGKVNNILNTTQICSPFMKDTPARPTSS
jgi:hypothetical protein